MLRNANLIPLSHQHQHSLALCVRINRALDRGEKDTAMWHGEIQQLFNSEIGYHFEAEEKFLFPAAEQIDQAGKLVAELRSEHDSLRRYVCSPPNNDARQLRGFATLLENHIRKEERQLFEIMQQALTEQQLNSIGTRLIEYLRGHNTPLE